MAALSLHIESPGAPPIDHECGPTPLCFGRSTEADIVVGDGSMSRKHARILPEGDEWLIEDLGARNGTFVNGERIEGKRRIEPGDVIQMGATLVRVSERGMPLRMEPQRVLGLGELGSSIFRPVADLSDDEALRRAAPARAAARLKALNDFHRTLAEPISLEALLARLLDRLFAALSPEEGVILLRQPDGQLAPAASRRRPDATGDLVISRRLVDEVVEKNTAALVSDVEMDDRFSGAQSMIGSGIRSILAVPIADSAGCVGMVALYSHARVRRFGEEDLELLVSLASAAALRIRNVALAEEAAERRVHDRELALAHDIQMAMLPRHTPSRAEVDVAAVLTPARAVGGDLYDFLVTGDDLWFVVADAAGKGVSAALYMAVTRTLFRAVAQTDTPVPEVIGRMNAELARDNEGQFFVTALVGRLHLPSGELRYCNGGHLPPLLARERDVAAPDTEGGMALGILEETTYPESRVQLSAGDLLLLVTDGITEATDKDGNLFTDARLTQVLRTCASRSPREVVDCVIENVTTFTAGAPQQDDLTLLAIRYRGQTPGRAT